MGDEKPDPAAVVAAAAAAEGYRPLVDVTGDDKQARGMVAPVYGREGHPCFMCRSFEKPDLGKMIQHMVARGGKLLPNGRIRANRPREASGTPIELDPREFGFCRRDTIAVQLEATCENWQQKQTRRDF